ncbi:MAG: DUF2784 domain-containing protein [Acidimicrobiales bacterium]
MVYRIAADGVVVVHFGFIVFVAVGGVVAWRWPRLLWLHVAAVAWGIGIVVVGFVCPLTPLERYLRRQGDEQGYEGGFVDRYIEDVIYPGEYTWVARTLIAAAVIVGWTGVTVRWARRRSLAVSANAHHARGAAPS